MHSYCNDKTRLGVSVYVFGTAFALALGCLSMAAWLGGGLALAVTIKYILTGVSAAATIATIIASMGAGASIVAFVVALIKQKGIWVAAEW